MLVLHLFGRIFVRLPRTRAAVREALLLTRVHEEQVRCEVERRRHQAGITTFHDPIRVLPAEGVHIGARLLRCACRSDFPGHPRDGIQIEQSSSCTPGEPVRQSRFARTRIAEDGDAQANDQSSAVSRQPSGFP
jgi:hypothetical protein